MIAATVAAVTTAALCLVFPETRWLGVVAAVVLAYLHPLALLAVVLAFGIVSVFHFNHRRRLRNVQAEQNARSD